MFLKRQYKEPRILLSTQLSCTRLFQSHVPYSPQLLCNSHSSLHQLGTLLTLNLNKIPIRINNKDQRIDTRSKSLNNRFPLLQTQLSNNSWRQTNSWANHKIVSELSKLFSIFLDNLYIGHRLQTLLYRLGIRYNKPNMGKGVGVLRARLDVLGRNIEVVNLEKTLGIILLAVQLEGGLIACSVLAAMGVS